MITIFLNPQLLQKFQDKAQKIAQDWDYPRDQFFQVYTMVAVIELGLTERCFYHTGKDGKVGIVYEGWNGYRHTAINKSDPNPYSAYNGFYRMEKNQMVGWSCYLTYRKLVTEGNDAAYTQLHHCGNVYSYFFEWEPEPRIWGFLNFQDYYTEDEAQTALTEALTRLGKYAKRHSVEYSDISGCWRVRIETTTKKAGLRDGWKGRIAA